MGSENEAEDLYNNSVILDLTALLIATWLGWPDTPPSSKVTICRKESATSNSNPSLWLVAYRLHSQDSTKTAGYHHETSDCYSCLSCTVVLPSSDVVMVTCN